jgi:hypothetical protein
MSAPEPRLTISAAEANRWWQKNDPVGAILNRLMLVFVLGPMALAYKEYFLTSAVVFAFLVPYGFLMRYLAVVTVRHRIAKNPESLSEFMDAGVVNR